ncbi:MAG: septum formation initiator family protein [Parcubacteria group bacterium]
MGKYVLFAIFITAIGFVGYQTYGMLRDYRDLSGEVSEAKDGANRLTNENEELKERIEYLGKPENLIKEIKSRFNYRLPDERTIIVAPERNN